MKFLKNIRFIHVAGVLVVLLNLAVLIISLMPLIERLK
jgi:hypothetical protein